MVTNQTLITLIPHRGGKVVRCAWNVNVGVRGGRRGGKWWVSKGEGSQNYGKTHRGGDTHGGKAKHGLKTSKAQEG